MEWTELYFKMKVIGELAGLVLFGVILLCWVLCFVMDWWETKQVKKRRGKK